MPLQLSYLLTYVPCLNRLTDLNAIRQVHCGVQWHTVLDRVPGPQREGEIWGLGPPTNACSCKFAAATRRIETRSDSAFYRITLVLVSRLIAHVEHARGTWLADWLTALSGPARRPGTLPYRPCSGSDVGTTVRRYRERPCNVRHRRLLGQPDDSRAGLHQLRAHAARAAGDWSQVVPASVLLLLLRQTMLQINYIISVVVVEVGHGAIAPPLN